MIYSANGYLDLHRILSLTCYPTITYPSIFDQKREEKKFKGNQFLFPRVMWVIQIALTFLCIVIYSQGNLSIYYHFLSSIQIGLVLPNDRHQSYSTQITRSSFCFITYVTVFYVFIFYIIYLCLYFSIIFYIIRLSGIFSFYQYSYILTVYVIATITRKSRSSSLQK